MIEKIFYNDSEYLELYVPDKGNIMVSLSGGADSALLAYILAFHIKERGLPTKVYLITCEVLTRPYNLLYSYEVSKKIEELLDFRFEKHFVYGRPDHIKKFSSEQKVEFHSRYVSSYMKSYQIEELYSGLTANPPEDVLPDTENAERERCRDDLSWRRDLEVREGLQVPFIHIDKLVIAKLFDHYQITEALLPITRSCESDLEESDFFKKTCFEIRSPGEECWWCREKAYGFRLSP